MNKELVTIANDVIREMREEGWHEDDIKWSTSGALLKYCDEHNLISDVPSKEDLAAILALVKHCMKESEANQA